MKKLLKNLLRPSREINSRASVNETEGESRKHWLVSHDCDLSELHNLITLLLAMFDGDATSRFILADLLEDAGRSRAADLARSESEHSKVLLEVAFGAAPARAALVLGCDFVEHILTREPREYPGKRVYLWSLQRVREWCRGESTRYPTSSVILFETGSEQDVRSINYGSGGRSNSRWPLRRTMLKLADAVKALLAEYEVAPVGTRPWFDEIGLTDVHVIMTAHEAREQPASDSRRDEINAQTELEWQLNRTGEFLLDVLDSIDGR